ncbi:MAG: hypothetical protein Q8T03_03695 [Bacteroidota bacterium]|nr:hypothetical protein [Bacteroidota bacterium]
MKIIIKFFAIALLISFVACKKDAKDPEPEPTPVTPAPTTGTLKLEFEHMVDTLPLDFVQSYVNANLDTFKISTLKYYISNVVLTKTDNSTFVESNSYHLVDVASPVSTILNIANVPVGSYKSLSFTLGVDSARNNSGAQTGDLDPAKGMFWTWTSGYIMFKLEGSSPQSGSTGKGLTYHIGGFGGVNKTQRNFNFNFASTTSNITGSNSPMIHLAVDINEFFKNPTTINVATQFFQMSTGVNAKTYADNYADMISFEHVHN